MREVVGLLSGSAAVAVETFLRPHPALSMSGSSLLVALNTLALRWTRLPGIRRWGPVAMGSSQRAGGLRDAD